MALFEGSKPTTPSCFCRSIICSWSACTSCLRSSSWWEKKLETRWVASARDWKLRRMYSSTSLLTMSEESWGSSVEQVMRMMSVLVTGLHVDIALQGVDGGLANDRVVDVAEGERPLGADEGLVVGEVQVAGHGQHQGVALEDGDLGGDPVGTLTAGGSGADAELVGGAAADLNGSAGLIDAGLDDALIEAVDEAEQDSGKDDVLAFANGHPRLGQSGVCRVGRFGRGWRREVRHVGRTLEARGTH